jgi:tetratricopeptide (TPR) repeat protein
MDKIGPPDSFHLSAALGWMELGNPAEADGELNLVSEPKQKHPAVLELRWQVCAQRKDWARAWEVARDLVTVAPESPGGWLYQAYAARRAPGGGLETAWQALLPAAEKFPRQSLVSFNLACYACQMGRLDDARQWLKRAIGVGGKKKTKAMAMQDEDLRPLWPEIPAM